VSPLTTSRIIYEHSWVPKFFFGENLTGSSLLILNIWMGVAQPPAIIAACNLEGLGGTWISTGLELETSGWTLPWNSQFEPIEQTHWFGWMLKHVLSSSKGLSGTWISTGLELETWGWTQPWNSPFEPIEQTHWFGWMLKLVLSSSKGLSGTWISTGLELETSGWTLPWNSPFEPIEQTHWFCWMLMLKHVLSSSNNKYRETKKRDWVHGNFEKFHANFVSYHFIANSKCYWKAYV
jgi:hypothetical protein